MAYRQYQDPSLVFDEAEVAGFDPQVEAAQWAAELTVTIVQLKRKLHYTPNTRQWWQSVMKKRLKALEDLIFTFGLPEEPYLDAFLDVEIAEVGKLEEEAVRLRRLRWVKLEAHDAWSHVHYLATLGILGTEWDKARRSYMNKLIQRRLLDALSMEASERRALIPPGQNKRSLEKQEAREKQRKEEAAALRQRMAEMPVEIEDDHFVG